jgi:hypothetical protein
MKYSVNERRVYRDACKLAVMPDTEKKTAGGYMPAI